MCKRIVMRFVPFCRNGWIGNPSAERNRWAIGSGCHYQKKVAPHLNPFALKHECGLANNSSVIILHFSEIDAMSEETVLSRTRRHSCTLLQSSRRLPATALKLAMLISFQSVRVAQSHLLRMLFISCVHQRFDG
jgi:hypothetical protein